MKFKRRTISRPDILIRQNVSTILVSEGKKIKKTVSQKIPVAEMETVSPRGA